MYSKVICAFEARCCHAIVVVGELLESLTSWQSFVCVSFIMKTMQFNKTCDRELETFLIKDMGIKTER